MKISASVVIYKEEEKNLKKLFDSFFSLSIEKVLIVIDNSPSNNLKEFCESFDNLKYIFTGENLGFGKGHNLALNYLPNKSDIHMIINPDIYFDADEISNYLKWFYEQKNISLSTPKVCYPDGTNQNIVRNIPTIFSLIKRKLKLNMDEIIIEDNTIQDIPFAHGCFMIFKTDVFLQLKGFDERFFMYMEDIDIFIRAKDFGKTVINTNFKVFHEHRKGSSVSLKLFLIHLNSTFKFFSKYKK